MGITGTNHFTDTNGERWTVNRHDSPNAKEPIVIVSNTNSPIHGPFSSIILTDDMVISAIRCLIKSADPKRVFDALRDVVNETVEVAA